MTQEHIMKVTIDILKVVMRYDEWTLPFSGYSKFPDNDQVDDACRLGSTCMLY